MDFEGISRRCVSVNFFFSFQCNPLRGRRTLCSAIATIELERKVNRLFSIRIIMQLTE